MSDRQTTDTCRISQSRGENQSGGVRDRQTTDTQACLPVTHEN